MCNNMEPCFAVGVVKCSQVTNPLVTALCQLCTLSLEQVRTHCHEPGKINPWETPAHFSPKIIPFQLIQFLPLSSLHPSVSPFYLTSLLSAYTYFFPFTASHVAWEKGCTQDLLCQELPWTCTIALPEDLLCWKSNQRVIKDIVHVNQHS